jgi:hypothetical protein
LARQYRKYEQQLDHSSRDGATPAVTDVRVDHPHEFEVGPMRLDEAAAVARIHSAFVTTGEMRGGSLASLGADFLCQTFYSRNFDNPYFFCDVARLRGEVIGFSVFTTDHSRVFQGVVSRHGLVLLREGLKVVFRRPRTLLSLARNAGYLMRESTPVKTGVDGWWIVTGVMREYRSAEGEARIGHRVATELFDRMEQTMRAHGCKGWFGVVRPENVPINLFLKRRGGTEVGTVREQGLTMRYYRKVFSQVPQTDVAEAVGVASLPATPKS